MPLAQRSAVPTIPGVPAWGAVAIAAAATFVGFVIDAVRGSELTSAFAVFYFLGCVAAVLAVRNRAVFTAMVQPPLLLVVAVPLAYQQFSSGSGGGLKDLLLNVAIPLVNRFPLMLTTTLVVVALGAGRMYIRRQAAGVIARPARRSEARRRTDAGSRPDSGTDLAAGSDEPVPASEPERVRRPGRPVRRAAAHPADTPHSRPAHAPANFATGRYPVAGPHDEPAAERTESFDRPQPAPRSRPQDRHPADERRRGDQRPPREGGDLYGVAERYGAAASHARPVHDPRDALDHTQVHQYDPAPRHTGPAYTGGQPVSRTSRHEYRADSEVPMHPVPRVRYRDRGDAPQDPPHRYR